LKAADNDQVPVLTGQEAKLQNKQLSSSPHGKFKHKKSQKLQAQQKSEEVNKSDKTSGMAALQSVILALDTN
jgi:hypothetical protein